MSEPRAERPVIPKQPECNIGTSGHVDSGKTSIVQAITGVWASAHSEELRRGITIKVGYADAAFYKCQYTPVPGAYSTSPTCPGSLLAAERGERVVHPRHVTGRIGPAIGWVEVERLDVPLLHRLGILHPVVQMMAEGGYG